MSTHTAPTTSIPLQRLFTREVGSSPVDYVERVRIDATRRMLERTDDGLGRVARQCGYAGVETFLRALRRRMGVTNGEYRDRFRIPVTTPARPPRAEATARRS